MGQPPSFGAPQMPPSMGSQPDSTNPADFYTCPFSGQKFKKDNIMGLANHIVSKYPDKPGVCPICATKPGGDPNYVSVNLSAHFNLRHSDPSPVP